MLDVFANFLSFTFSTKPLGKAKGADMFQSVPTKWINILLLKLQLQDNQSFSILEH